MKSVLHRYWKGEGIYEDVYEIRFTLFNVYEAQSMSTSLQRCVYVGFVSYALLHGEDRVVS